MNIAVVDDLGLTQLTRLVGRFFGAVRAGFRLFDALNAFSGYEVVRRR